MSNITLTEIVGKINNDKFHPGETCYVVNSEWFRSLKCHLESSNGSTFVGFIDNHHLLNKISDNFSDSITVEDIILVNGRMWDILSNRFGKSVSIELKVPLGFTSEIYESNEWMNKVDLRKLTCRVVARHGHSPSFTSTASARYERIVDNGNNILRRHARQTSFNLINVFSTRFNYSSSIEIQIIGSELRPEIKLPQKYYVEYIIQIVSVLRTKKPWIVRRRYQDFNRLHSILQRYCKLERKLTLPSLPSKRYFGSTLSSSFIENRRLKLELYLSKMASQPSTWNCQDFMNFLDYDEHVITSSEDTVNPVERFKSGCIIDCPTLNSQSPINLSSPSDDETYSNSTEQITIEENALIECDLDINQSRIVGENKLLRYPENSPRTDAKPGVYYGHLNNRTVNAHPSAIFEDLTLLRYLRVHNMNVDKAIEHIQKNIDYRESIRFSDIMNKLPDEFLGIRLHDLCQYYQHWQYGYDKLGCPVVYQKFGSFAASKIKKMTAVENVFLYHMWENEVNSRLCSLKSQELGVIVDTITTVVDCSGMKFSQVNNDFIHILSSFGNIDSERFPEPFGRCYVINGPFGFATVWNMMKRMVDPITAKSIHVLGGPDDWQPILFETIGKENMPSNYGGLLPPLSLDRHPYADYMKIYHPHEDASHWTSAKWQS